MRLPGEVVITRPQGDKREVISIQVTDEVSRTRFLEIEIPLADFARTVTGMYVNCELELRHLDRIGKRVERKHEIVRIPTSASIYSEDGKQVLREAIAAFEVDGWMGYDRSVNTQSSYQRDQSTDEVKAYRIEFTRYVEAAAREPTAK